MCVSYVCVLQVKARGHEVYNSVLKQLCVSELQVFGLAVLRGQLATVWEFRRQCLEFLWDAEMKGGCW